MVIGFNGENCQNFGRFIIKLLAGEVDDDIDFTFEQNTEVYGSCATSLEGEMWVLGGEQQQRQVYITKVLQKRSFMPKY